MITAADAQRTSSGFLTAANILSISRAVLSVPFVLVMLSGSPNARWWGLAIIIVAVATDRLDGALARRYNQVTEWGKILDPIADKIGVAAVGLVLLARGEIQLWFVAALLGRDLLIFAGGIFLKIRLGLILPSNVAGKWTIGVVAVTLTFALMEVPPWLMTTGLAASSFMLLLSLAMYGRVFVQRMKG